MVISTLPPAGAPAADVDLLPLPPPQAAMTRAIAPASAARTPRCDLDSDPIMRRDAIDAPPETFEVLRSSQPTTHHVERGPGSECRRPIAVYTLVDGR